ncbi:uncharacterized protein LOC130368889 isoform X1 [Hyla sarda]|uniref:uncharacterized protein LOC130368889 isoform X1 n=1 Tax=Hyla sarda TaxID=327740 RepID=UPI0024C320CB|nr:uncharacterized protein LOC130368889 isoform X1 [Hyla sarda]
MSPIAAHDKTHNSACGCAQKSFPSSCKILLNLSLLYDFIWSYFKFTISDSSLWVLNRWNGDQEHACTRNASMLQCVTARFLSLWNTNKELMFYRIGGSNTPFFSLPSWARLRICARPLGDSGSLTKRAESPETAVTTRVCPRRSCRCPASCVYVHGLHGIKSWCTSLRHQPSTLKIYARSGVVRPPGPHRSQQGTSSHKGTT